MWQIHSGSPEDVEKGEALAVMQEAQAAGKVRFTGLSCGWDGAIAALENGGFDTIQISYSILDRHMEERVLPLAQEKTSASSLKTPSARDGFSPRRRD